MVFETRNSESRKGFLVSVVLPCVVSVLTLSLKMPMPCWAKIWNGYFEVFGEIFLSFLCVAKDLVRLCTVKVISKDSLLVQ